MNTLRVSSQTLRPFFTPKALAEYLSISERTVPQMLSEGRIPSYGYDATRFDFYSPEGVWSLVRAAASDQDGPIFLTAACTGLRRGELIALCWRDVDFERSAVRVAGSYANGKLTAPKSGQGRAVPMVPEVAEMLARLSHRAEFVGDDDLVFPGEVGGYRDGSALRRRFLAACGGAGLRPIRFHEYADVRVMPMSGRRALPVLVVAA